MIQNDDWRCVELKYKQRKVIVKTLALLYRYVYVSYINVYQIQEDSDMNEVQKPKNRLSFISVWWRLKLLQTNISAATRL